MQSVPITTNVVNSNPSGEVYSIQHYVIKFVSDLRMSLVFSCYFGFNSSNNIIDNITKKANATCAFLRRNINSCSRQVKAQCYTTLVRPNLEYAATVWDPYTKFNKQIRKMPTSCCQICEWGLLERKQCYIYAKGTKMANFTTKKNQHKNGNDVRDSPPPYGHTIANVPYSCNHQNNKRS